GGTRTSSPPPTCGNSPRYRSRIPLLPFDCQSDPRRSAMLPVAALLFPEQVEQQLPPRIGHARPRLRRGRFLARPARHLSDLCLFHHAHWRSPRSPSAPGMAVPASASRGHAGRSQPTNGFTASTVPLSVRAGCRPTREFPDGGNQAAREARARSVHPPPARPLRFRSRAFLCSSGLTVAPHIRRAAALAPRPASGPGLVAPRLLFEEVEPLLPLGLGDAARQRQVRGLVRFADPARDPGHFHLRQLPHVFLLERVPVRCVPHTTVCRPGRTGPGTLSTARAPSARRRPRGAAAARSAPGP